MKLDGTVNEPSPESNKGFVNLVQAPTVASGLARSRPSKASALFSTFQALPSPIS